MNSTQLFNNIFIFLFCISFIVNVYGSQHTSYSNTDDHVKSITYEDSYTNTIYIYSTDSEIINCTVSVSDQNETMILSCHNSQYCLFDVGNVCVKRTFLINLYTVNVTSIVYFQYNDGNCGYDYSNESSLGCIFGALFLILVICSGILTIGGILCLLRRGFDENKYKLREESRPIYSNNTKSANTDL